MSRTGLEVFDKTLQATNHWLKLMMIELGTNDRRLAFNALRGALHAVRDRIGPDNAVHLGAQMPMLLRGAYYQGEVDPEDAARAGFAVMAQCLDPGEMDKLLRILPYEARYLWPEGAVH